jgi:hypothetical protein
MQNELQTRAMVGLIMPSGALVAVELTASAVQMVAMHAGSKRVADWQIEQQRELAFAPVRASNMVEALPL